MVYGTMLVVHTVQVIYHVIAMGSGVKQGQSKLGTLDFGRRGNN